MSDGPREKKLFVEISAAGRARTSDPARARLAHVPGLFRLVPEVGRLMVLERVVDNRDRSRTTRSREVTLAGVFDNGNELASTLDYVQMAGLGGSMHIDSGEVKAILYFRRGVYLAGRSNLSRDRLGAVLVRAGLISERERDEVIDEQADGSRLGSMLVARGLVTTPQVYEGLRIQSEEIFYATLRLTSGSFHLVAPLDMTEVPAMLRLDVKQLLMEGVRRLDESGGHGTLELRRREPIPSDRLPPDAGERIFDAYNAALRAMFESLEPAACEAMVSELSSFIDNNEAHGDLFKGVEIMTDGSLGIEVLENLGSLKSGDPMVRLQQGLSELLFYLMFAAGDALDPQVEQVLHGRVAESLAKLPT